MVGEANWWAEAGVWRKGGVVDLRGLPGMESPTRVAWRVGSPPHANKHRLGGYENQNQDRRCQIHSQLQGRNYLLTDSSKIVIASRLKSI